MVMEATASMMSWTSSSYFWISAGIWGKKKNPPKKKASFPREEKKSLNNILTKKKNQRSVPKNFLHFFPKLST
jgi:hypothetical protein